MAYTGACRHMTHNNGTFNTCLGCGMPNLETEYDDSENQSVTLIAIRGTKTITVENVRADSVTVCESRMDEFVDIGFEMYGNTLFGTIPMVDYFIIDAD